jgi:hypothetical protein
MSYEEALKAAGADIIAFENFGSYQGEWWAKVKYKGEVGWINGSFGSCSSCDAFEAEFGWHDEDKPDYQERLISFGSTYLDGLMTQEQAEKSASAYIEWDSDAEDMIEFLTQNKI